jgi:cell division protein FtsB
MPSTTNGTTTPTDVELVSTLEAALTTARAELAELEPRREMLAARVAQLEATVAVFKGEPVPAPKRRASKRRASKRAADAPVETTPAA